MSVVVIGDRGVGKTSMVVALAKSPTKHISVASNADGLVAKFSNPETGEIAGTWEMKVENLLLNIELPSGKRQIQVLWIDTPGEAFSNRDWRTKFPTAWQDMEEQICQSKGVILLIPPHRDMVQPYLVDSRTNKDELPTYQAWCNRLETWLNFFNKNCQHVEHILICIHRADTFCNIEAEGKKWRYDNTRNRLFFEYNNYVFQSYFTSAQKLIRSYHSHQYRASLRFFITSIDNPYLLELPWVYLGSYLANS